MKRRAFLQWLAAGAATLGAVGEIDYEKALWIPGQKKIFLPSESIFQPTPAMVDRVLAAHGVGVPRYHLTIAGRGTVFYDENWRPLSGRSVDAKPFTVDDINRFQHVRMV